MARRKRTVPDDWAYQRIAPRMEELGLSFVDVASYCGIKDPATVKSWADGSRRPRMPAFLKLLQVLEMDFWDLMPGD